jgi:DNA polymerase
MSTERDDPQRLVTDFLTWIRQNEAAGMEWFLDESDPASAVTPAPAPEASDPAPADAPKPAATSDVSTRPTDSFEQVCARFVEETLPLIRIQPPRLPTDHPVKDKAAALATLRDEVLPCTACALHEGRHSTVFGAGSPDAEVVFIGEAPGRDEDLQGEPFVGRSGQLLTKILAAIGYARSEVFICNILKCRPPNNRDPQPGEVNACEPHLIRQLAILDPVVICCLGRVAAQTLLGTDMSLKRLRESVHFYQGIPVMATYHPAALLRNPGWKRETWNDVRKLRALVDALKAGES